MTDKEKQFNQWFDEYADGVKVFEEADMKQAYLQGRADLEKENAELEQKLEQTEKDLADYQFNYPTTKELQKENAELKDYRLNTLKEQQTGIQKYALNLEHKLNWYDDKLTKAKEIIKNLMEFAEMDDREYEKEYKEAEQFLKESE